jgi:hypothetical protein
MLEAPPSESMIIKRLWVLVRSEVIDAVRFGRTRVELADRLERVLVYYPTNVRRELAEKAATLYNTLDAKAKSRQP